MQKHLALVLTSEPTQGGKFQYSISLLEALAALSPDAFRLSVIYFDGQWEKFIPSGADCIGRHRYRVGILSRAIRKTVLQLPFGLELWRHVGSTFHPLHRLLQELGPELVFYPGNDPYVYESRLRGVVPIFDVMHRYEKRFPEVSQSGVYEFRERHYRNICRYARGILVDSELGKQHVMESYRVAPEIIHVLPYVPPKAVAKNAGTNVRDKYGLPPKFFFYPAQFWEHKNHSGLLRAMAELKTGKDDIKFVFVGSKKNGYGKMVSLMHELGLGKDVTILGYVSDEDVVGFYKTALGLVMPTFFGPTNIPPLEAFALGCPVAVSNVYSMPDQVGDAALLFDPKNTDDIADKLLALWTDDRIRKQLVERGYRKSLEWNQNTFNARVADIVRQIVGQ